MVDRPFWYFGVVPRDTDFLNADRFPMVGIGKLAEAVLGSGIAAQGFASAPTVPASLSVNIGPGQVYQLANLEATQWAAFGPDTHSIVKQGISLDAQTQTFVAPTNSGYAQNFLIQVAYADQDQGSTVLPYYNAANPTQPYSGPGNSGTAQNTVRAGVANLTVKAGIAANAGTQNTPTPDAGYAGLWVVTLTAGQTTITAGNIVQYQNAPFIPVTLPGVPAGVQSGKWTYGVDSGSASNLVLSLSPAPSSLTVGQEIVVKPVAAPNGATVANVAGIGNLAVVRRGGLAVAANDWSVNDVIVLRYTGSSLMLAGLVPSDVLALTATAPAGRHNVVYSTPGTYSWTCPAGVYWVYVYIWGAGAGGGGASASACGGGGGGGAFGMGWVAVVPGTTYTITVGNAGGGGAPGANNGGFGGSSGISGLCAASGGGGGVGSSSGAQTFGAGGNIITGIQLGFGGGSGGSGLNPGSIFLGGSGGAAALGGSPSPLTAGTGTIGNFPGGGGSGGANNSSGGAGANGCVAFFY